MGVNHCWGLEGVLARLRSPLRRTGLAIALAAGLLGSTVAKAEWAPPTNTTLSELNGSVSRDGRRIYFSSGGPFTDIWYATRTDRDSPWVNPTNLTEVNSPEQEMNPFISNDEKTLYFTSHRDGNWDIYYATRTDTSSPFSTPQPLIEVNSPASENMGSLSCDERTIYFSSDRSGGMGYHDIYVAMRPDTSSPFDQPVNLMEVNSREYELGGFISEDDLELYITWLQSGTNEDLRRATRPDASVPFSTPVPLTELNTPGVEKYPSISFDGTELHYTSNATGVNEIWKTTRAMGTGSCASEPPPVEDCTDGKWSAAIAIRELSTPDDDSAPSISKSGTAIYWNRGTSIWEAVRSNRTSPFGSRALRAELEGYSSPDISADGLEVFLSDQSLLFRANRSSTTLPFDAPVEIPELNAVGGGAAASISLDGRVLYYGDKFGNSNLWFTERQNSASPFSAPQELQELDPVGRYAEWAPSISASGLQLYYTSNKDTNLSGHLYVADRPRINSHWRNPHKVETPSPDANGDYLPRSQEPSISSDGTELFFQAPQADGDYGLYKVTRCPVEIDQDLDGQTLGIDCNDIEPRAGSGREEVCDFVDNDCDGTIDGPVRPGEVSVFPVNIDLLMAKVPGGRLNFTWENLRSCATAYNIYEGEIGSFYSHSPLLCHITSAVPTPDGKRLRYVAAPNTGSRYYLVNASNLSGEGITGFNSSNGEIDPIRNTCGPF